MTVIVKAVHTCYGLPSAWDVWTETGDYLHFKCRYGTAKVYTAAGPDDEAFELESALRYGDPRDGITTLDEFCAAMGFTLALREPYAPLPDPNGGYDYDGDAPWAKSVV